MHVIGRTPDDDGPVCRFGTYRARDGSDGASVGLDVNHPHAAVVVGKRGSGKSHTLGVVAEGLARADGVAPVVVDPMGVFGGLCDSPIDATVHESPTVRADALPPSAWPDLLGLDSTGPVGSLVWRLAAETDSLAEMGAAVADADVAPETRRAATNHLSLAESWDVFDPAGLAPDSLCGSAPDVLDLSGMDSTPASVVVRVVARGLYDARVEGEVERIPWLLVDEAHAFVGTTAEPALRTILTRGRAPGAALVLATQRPSALPDVAVSQADLRIVHRLTAGPDVSAMAAVDPTYFDETLRSRLPRERGCALVVDDTTESVHDVRVRPRETTDCGASPTAVSAHVASENVE
ncbi:MULTISPECIES: ATP-binding protein [Haloferax]|uniref:ATPase n=1 Tax=Haloferax marinum TaxID=2666143 RepID=A0A6A8G6R6_9EURY|nr:MULTISPECIES: ATP-binding protein [Haloferax]KAB1197401.1 ATP-binding protein [Haloferax sp. CBA1150]MRW96445.1 ATPase [Haloferax marinum]